MSGNRVNQDLRMNQGLNSQKDTIRRSSKSRNESPKGMKEAGTQSGDQGLANPAWQNHGFAQSMVWESIGIENIRNWGNQARAPFPMGCDKRGC